MGDWRQEYVRYAPMGIMPEDPWEHQYRPKDKGPWAEGDPGSLMWVTDRTGGGIGGMLGSVFSGGLSDVYKGNAPFTEAAKEIGVPDKLIALQQFGNEVFNPASRGWKSIKGFTDSDVGFNQAADYAIDVPKVDENWDDPKKRKGMIDWGFREMGELQPDWLKKDVIGPVGSIIAGIYGPGPAALFQGAYSKSLGEDYDAGFKRAGTAALLSYLGQQASGAAQGGAPEGGGMYDPVETGMDVGMDEPGWVAPESWGTPPTVPNDTGGMYNPAETGADVGMDEPGWEPPPEWYDSPNPPQDIPNAPGTPETPSPYTKAAKEVAKKLVQKYGVGLLTGLFTQEMPDAFTPAQAPQVWQKYAGLLTPSTAQQGTLPKGTGMSPEKGQWAGTEADIYNAKEKEKKVTEEMLQYLKMNPQALQYLYGQLA